MNPKMPRTTSYLILVAVLALILLFLPLPQKSRHTGLVLPVAEYQIITNGNGSFEVALKDLWSNQNLKSDHVSADRDGLLAYHLNPALRGRQVVAVGDTLAWITSSNLESEILDLEGDLKTLRATLAFERSGSRETEIEAARQRLSYARTRYEEQQAILKRSEELFEKKFISQQEYDQDVSRERLDAIRISIAEADLASALTGAPVSKLAVIQSQIADVEQKLKLQRGLLQRMTLTSPLAGQLSFSMGPDTLLSIGQVDTVVVLIPIPAEPLASRALTADLRIQAAGRIIQAAPDQIKHDQQILNMGNRQMLLVRVRLPNPEGQLIPGQRLETAFLKQPSSVFQMILEMF